MRADQTRSDHIHGDAPAPGNALLDLLDPLTQATLSPLVPVRLERREILHEPGVPALYAYFPVNAVISLVSMMENGAATEVALIGREGLLGLESVLGSVGGPTMAVVHVAGLALRTPLTALKTARATSAPIRKMLDLYMAARFIQVSQRVACNRLHHIEARLARWLLEVADRTDSDTLTVPHEIIARMIGAGRPTVTSALGRFHDQGVIDYRGRALRIVDRCALEALACECYGLVRGAFRRLLGHGLKGPVASGLLTTQTKDEPPGDSAVIEMLRELAGRLLAATLREQEAREQAEAANNAKDKLLAKLPPEWLASHLTDDVP
jgi:CRP-like cAMP-binding protein